jgi:hypothetical protein
MRRSVSTRGNRTVPSMACRELGLKQSRFVAEYLANGFNATRAYFASHPHCRSEAAASVGGHRTLRNAKVQRAISAEQADRFRRLKMDGDEAMALLAVIARANIADAFDRTGAMLPVHQWPLTLQLAVKSVKSSSITLHDGLKACELIARAAGRLSPKRSGIDGFDHVTYLAGLNDAGPE